MCHKNSRALDSFWSRNRWYFAVRIENRISPPLDCTFSILYNSWPKKSALGLKNSAIRVFVIKLGSFENSHVSDSLENRRYFEQVYENSKNSRETYFSSFRFYFFNSLQFMVWKRLILRLENFRFDVEHGRHVESLKETRVIRPFLRFCSFNSPRSAL